MKRAIILLAIFFLAISGVYGAAYPGGFFRDSIDMRGHEITNASNLATTSDVSGVVSQLTQSLSDDENSTAQSLSAINGTLDNHAQRIWDLENFTDDQAATYQDIMDAQNYTDERVSDRASEQDLLNLSGDVGNLQNGTAAINKTIGRIPDYSQDISDLQNSTSNITGNVTDLQGDMAGVLGGTFQVVETVIIPGESAGNHTIAAITANDFLDKVYYTHLTEGGNLSISDITSEFRGEGHSSGVVTDGLINNNNGTDTTGGFMTVSWYTRYMLFSM